MPDRQAAGCREANSGNAIFRMDRNVGELVNVSVVDCVRHVCNLLCARLLGQGPEIRPVLAGAAG